MVNAMLADGTHALIDEMMLEVHYGHPLMQKMFRWCTPRPPKGQSTGKMPSLPSLLKRVLHPRGDVDFWCTYSLDDATALYQSLRDAGVYAHSWP